HVDSLALEYEGGKTVRGAGGAGEGVATRIATAQRIALGDYAIENVRVIVLPGNPGFPPDIDGVIGAELFERYSVRVDADRREVAVFDTAGWTPPADSASVPLVVRKGMPFIDARVAVGDGAPETADIAVDLGAGHSLWLNQRDARFAPPARTVS